jgi:hypothetical protein
VTTVREMADPHLAAIRMVTHALRKGANGRHGRLGSQLEGARFGLFTALESGDFTSAMDWLNTLETGLGVLEAASHPSAASIGRALTSLREILEDETEEV